jgi:site-specific DNA recombinase
MVSIDTSGQPIPHAAPTSPYDRRILRLAFPAPDIQRAIIERTLPAHINLENLIHSEIPLDWDVQRTMFSLNANYPVMADKLRVNPI